MLEIPCLFRLMKMSRVSLLIDADTEDDGSTIELEISGGNDQDKFTLNVATNELSFINPPDYEKP